MSRNIIQVPQGQVSGIQLIQPSEYSIQQRFNNGAFVPTRTGYDTGNFVGGRFNWQKNKNIDINGLSQPVGTIQDPTGHTYMNNVTGLDSMYGGTYSTRLKADLSHYIPSTSMYNLIGFTDYRQINPLNEELYAYHNPPMTSEQYRRNSARGKYTSMLDGIAQNGGMNR